MAIYTFKNEKTGEECTVNCTMDELGHHVELKLKKGFKRWFKPVAVKDSGSGRG